MPFVKTNPILIADNTAEAWAVIEKTGDVDYITIDTVNTAERINLLKNTVIGAGAPDSNQKLGLTIDQGAGDDDIILAFQSSNCTHSFTDFADTDTYGSFQKTSDFSSGLKIRGFTDGAGANPVLIEGYNVDATAAHCIGLAGWKSDGGTDRAALAAAELLLEVLNGTTTVISVFGDAGTAINTEAVDSKSAIGLTINQAGNDDIILAFQSSDITHPFTDFADADTYGSFQKEHATTGGALIRGFASGGETNIGLVLEGHGDQGVEIVGWYTDGGTGRQAMAASDDVLSVYNGASKLFLIEGNGEVGIGVTPAQKFEIGSTDNSNRISIYHDNADAHFNWDDGVLTLKSVENANAQADVRIAGNGTGRADLYLMDGASSFTKFRQDAGRLEIGNSDTGDIWIDALNGDIQLNRGATGDIDIFGASTEGETKRVLISGFRAGGAADTLNTAVGIHVNQAASFYGCAGGYLIGDGTNYTHIQADGEIQLVGTAKVKTYDKLQFNETRITGQGKPTQVFRGAFAAYSLPIYNTDDEELFSCVCTPPAWDGTTDPVLYLAGWLTAAEDINDDFNLQVSVETYDPSNNDVVPVTTNDYTVETNVTDGTQFASYGVSFTLDASAIVIAAGQPLGVRIRRLAAAGTEIAGEFAIEGAVLIWTCNKLGQAT